MSIKSWMNIIVIVLYAIALIWPILLGEWQISVCLFLAIWAAKIEMKYIHN